MTKIFFSKFYFFLFIILFIGCAEKNNNTNNKDIITDTIPAARENINKKPAAEYIVQMDAKLGRKFGVDIYETAKTFKYKLVMYYDGITENDTLTIPDFGTWPVVKVIAGKEKLSCIIGFFDKEKSFREYKMLSLKDDKLRLSTLNNYGVATYSK